MIEKCLAWLRDHKPFEPASDDPATFQTWSEFSNGLWSPRYRLTQTVLPTVLYCSINIPHPPFDTNATWLAMVHADKVPLPTWPPQSSFHPADSCESSDIAERRCDLL